MSLVDVDIRGHLQVRQALQRCRDPKALAKEIRRRMRAEAAPILKAAKEYTPERTGRLRASLGIATVVLQWGRGGFAAES